MSFSDKWEKKSSPSFISRIIGGVRSQVPLKQQIEDASRQIQHIITRLDLAISRIKQRDTSIFSKVVSSLQKNDNEHAIMYANELSEIRKMGKMVTQARLALEQIMLRLTTITDIGEVASTLAPTVTVVRSLRGELAEIVPEAEGEMNEISNTLSSILVDAGTSAGVSLNFEAANEEAEKVLAEAAAIAEQRMKESFPEIPVQIIDSEKEEGSVS